MPVPAKFKEQKKQERLERITELAMLGYWQVKDCYDEVFGGSLPLNVTNILMKNVMREYVLNLEANNINLKDGQIEPHALYMRTFFMRRLREYEVLKHCIASPIPLPDGDQMIGMGTLRNFDRDGKLVSEVTKESGLVVSYERL